MTAACTAPGAPALVVHVIYRLDFGGLETLLVECINHMPAERYRHAVVCLTGYTEFARKIRRSDVELFALDKPPGLAPGIHLDLFRLLRRLRPAILHTYNFACAEYAFTAWAAGVPVRIHAEHGRDARDPQGLNRKHNLLRRALAPWIDRFVPVSHDLARWLTGVVGIPARKTELIMNGVDTGRFAPAARGAAPDDVRPFVIGTVGRLQEVKDQATLVDAFALLCRRMPAHAGALRLVVVGDGPLREQLAQRVRAAGIEDLVWMAGARHDIPELMRDFSLFALSSLAEGTPVTVLEAMACALPVVASGVGGIPDVVQDGVHGRLVPPADPAALADALAAYVADPALARAHGMAGRLRIEQHYSVTAMVGAYLGLYDRLRAVTINPEEMNRTCAE
ncbi:TIGR03088 family PEP-CTERM/XrtA system glycosyltransferase [Massilia sp. HP4]|uniref:TIGR03088 family PEP-CTERM/XrtA system glycosyltransferase n=1 Tax=Massilia sp. HP4 TaxID=2562316 RepID=UPI0010C0BA4D|nr:TIGR03088 family PEP-CTERM/XrtA system glycosyltransferase [Massilia sp. HP4]